MAYKFAVASIILIKLCKGEDCYVGNNMLKFLCCKFHILGTVVAGTVQVSLTRLLHNLV